MTDNTALYAVALPEIKREESCRLTAYRDTKGIWTIGWGRADAGVTDGMTCTQAEADEWLLQHCDGVCASLDAEIPWWRGLTVPRQAVLLSMAYQMGIRGLLAFHHALEGAQIGDWAAAKAGMLNSDWAKIETPARAERLAEQMLTGVAS